MTDKLTEWVEQIHLEGQGVWQISIYSLEGVAEVLGQALAGDPHAMNIILTLERMLRDIRKAARTRLPKLCLTCDNTFSSKKTMPAAWVLMHAMRDDPKMAVGNGICLECWRRYPNPVVLMPVVTEVYRQKMIPDLRVLPPAAGQGHA